MESGWPTSPNIARATLLYSTLLCSALSTLFSSPFRHLDATLLYYTLELNFVGHFCVVDIWQKLMIFRFPGLAWLMFWCPSCRCCSGTGTMKLKVRSQKSPKSLCATPSWSLMNIIHIDGAAEVKKNTTIIFHW